MRVRDLMTTQVLSLKPTDTMHDAKVLMANERFRHVPIVGEDGLFQGLVSQRDILAAGISRLADIDADEAAVLDNSLTLDGLMHTEVMVVGPEASVREAAELMLAHKIGCLPVLEDGRPVGILTESDYMKLVIQLLDSLDKLN